MNFNMETFSIGQLQAILTTLNTFDLDDWRNDIYENGLCDAAHHVQVMINRIEKRIHTLIHGYNDKDRNF